MPSSSDVIAIQGYLLMSLKLVFAAIAIPLSRSFAANARHPFAYRQTIPLLASKLTSSSFSDS